MPQDIVRDFGFLTLGTRFRRIGELLQAHTQDVMRQFDVGIPAAQYPFLAAIDRNGPLTVGELAETVGITQPGATRTIGQLAEAGLVEISVSDGDQRRKQITLTKKGEALIAFSKETVWPSIGAAVENLCGDLQGPLLQQLLDIEQRLAERPLLSRIGDRQEDPQ